MKTDRAIGILFAAMFAVGRAGAGEFVDDFKDLTQWYSNNKNAPAEFSAADGVLTLIDPPGGEATWGTSIYRKPLAIDLDATPYLAVKAVETTGKLEVALIDEATGQKAKNVIGLAKPGVGVVDVPSLLGWKGPRRVTVALYLQGTEKMAKVDWIKFTGSLTQEEKQVFAKTSKKKAAKMKGAASAQNPQARAQGKTQPFHGLTELATCHGWRRLEDAARGGAYLSERTVFRDTETGYTAWRLTCDPAVDKNDYYDIPAWNANGSLIGFLSRRAGDGASKRWLMDANGANLRPFPTPDGQEISVGYWSVLHPDRFYHCRKEGKGTRIVATNPYTGQEQTIVHVGKDLGDMQPPHPSEKWFLFGDRQKTEQTGDASIVYVVDTHGGVREIPLEKRWHRLRFTKSPDARIFFNFDDPRAQFTILPDGSGRTSIPDPGGHPDWLADGKELTYFNAGGVWAVRYDGTGKRLVMDLRGGGHGGPCPDGEWYVADTNRSGNYPGSILYLRTDGSQECHPLFKHMSAYMSHTLTWHPDHHSTHPHPVASPDGTKVLFNSDFMGQYTDIYVAVARPPDPPRDVEAKNEGGAVTLTWKEPRRCHETRGYLVYRGGQAARDPERLTAEPVLNLSWTDPAPAAGSWYAVTALEYSGLESGPSAAVSPGGSAAERITSPTLLDTTAPPTPQELKIAAVFPNALRLTWAKTPASDLDHYNVYCGHAADFACGQSSLIGSPSETEMVDWGLKLNAEYCYKVTAVDRAGNESAPTPAVRAATPPFEPVHVSLKPEAARGKNLKVSDSAEAGAKVLRLEKNQPGGEASWEFETPRVARCAIWVRATHSKNALGSLLLYLDGGDAMSGRIWGPWDKWGWSQLGGRSTGTPRLFELKAGRHTLRVKPGTDKVTLAELVITGDSAFP